MNRVIKRSKSVGFRNLGHGVHDLGNDVPLQAS